MSNAEIAKSLAEKASAAREQHIARAYRVPSAPESQATESPAKLAASHAMHTKWATASGCLKLLFELQWGHVWDDSANPALYDKLQSTPSIV